MADFSKYKFHPSSLGKIMTPGRNKEDLFGETAKKHLLECWVQETYGRRKDITNKYLEKGIAQEEESITLYSRVTKTFYKKNTEKISNDYLVGTPDLYEGESILKATKIKDIKTSWDIFTFYDVFHNAVKKDYEWQLQAYMDLTGAKEAGLVYCLVDTPQKHIEDAKRKLSWTLGLIDPDIDPEYIAGCEQIEKNMTFGDIPIEDRWIEFKIQRDEALIEAAHIRIQQCRNYLNEMNTKTLPHE
jgi:hypothetical protein